MKLDVTIPDRCDIHLPGLGGHGRLFGSQAGVGRHDPAGQRPPHPAPRQLREPVRDLLVQPGCGFDGQPPGLPAHLRRLPNPHRATQHRFPQGRMAVPEVEGIPHPFQRGTRRDAQQPAHLQRQELADEWSAGPARLDQPLQPLTHRVVVHLVQVGSLRDGNELGDLAGHQLLVGVVKRRERFAGVSWVLERRCAFRGFGVCPDLGDGGGHASSIIERVFECRPYAQPVFPGSIRKQQVASSATAGHRSAPGRRAPGHRCPQWTPGWRPRQRTATARARSR